MPNIFSGEQFQELCDIYIGDAADFVFNPRIASQTSKFVLLDSIPTIYNNPPLIFCYTHQIRHLASVLDRFQRPFILISHNSDTNIDDSYHDIANHERVFHWFTQNLCTNHPKISYLPIGVANEQWPHGQRSLFEIQYKPIPKSKELYFQFGPSNLNERRACFQALQAHFTFQNTIPPTKFLEELQAHKFAVSPAGNGIDCHRTWEALFCNCIPILRDSTFSRLVAKDYPVILVQDWKEITPEFISKLPQNNIISKDKLDTNFFVQRIREKAEVLLKNYIDSQNI